MTSNTQTPLRPRVLAYVGLGANLGDAAATVQHAIHALQKLPQTRFCAASRLYRSAPLDAGGPPYINAVARLYTALPAPALLHQLQRIEEAHGRKRPYRHAPRTLDLDLLLYGSGRIDSPALTVPHPALMQRAFVLQPLAEVAPHWVTPEALQRVAHQDCTPLAADADHGYQDPSAASGTSQLSF